MAESSTAVNVGLARVLNAVREILREKGRESGANIGHSLRRELPDFNPQTLGFPSLSRLLLEAADDLVVVGHKGDDRLWALGESVSNQEIEHALGAEPDLEEDKPSKLPCPPVPREDIEVHLVNFRSCYDVRLKLAPSRLTVLVGPNGSGKSTLLQGLSFVSQVTRGKLRALFSGPRDVRRLRAGGATGPMELTIRAGDEAELHVAAESLDEDTKFTVSLGSKGNRQSWSSPGEPPSPPLPSRPESRSFWPSVLLKFRAEALAAPSDVVEGEPRLSFDGYGLPTVLAHLANADPKRLQAIVENVREVVPAVEETRQRVLEANNTFQYRLEVKMRGVGWVPADLLSEGTLFAFGIHAVLQQRLPPRILLMDDIDRGLHPRAQRTLIQQLKNVCQGSGAQIVLSTHSPYILDELPAESVRVVRATDGRTYVRALVEHPEWEEWKASMTSGEFWTYVGEDWLEKAE